MNDTKKPYLKTYRVPVLCENCNYYNRFFRLKVGKQVAGSMCPDCGCPTIAKTTKKVVQKMFEDDFGKSLN